MKAVHNPASENGCKALFCGLALLVILVMKRQIVLKSNNLLISSPLIEKCHSSYREFVLDV
jgi:predicted membrane-bound spermidine synthase